MKTKKLEDKISAVVTAWSTLRPAKSFFGMTLEEFKTAIKPSLDARSAIAGAESSHTVALVQRDNVDETTWSLIRQVVSAVVADKDEGDDGELYKAMGYVRRSERTSGLTRGHGTPVTPIDQVAKAA